MLSKTNLRYSKDPLLFVFKTICFSYVVQDQIVKLRIPYD